MVSAVLIGFAVLSVPLFLFALMWIRGESDGLKEVTELEENGIEVQAYLRHLEHIRNTGTVRVVYEFRGPNGEKGRHQTGMGVSLVHVLGDTYPLVYHPRRMNHVHMGTMKAVSKARRERAGSLKGARWTALTSAVVCALAIAGLLLSP